MSVFSSWTFGIAATVLMWPVHAYGQEPGAAVAKVDRAGWVPGISVGIGQATVGTQSFSFTSPLVASLRVELLSHLFVEAEWTSPVTTQEYYDSGDSGVVSLNDQLGMYGRATRETRRDVRMSAVNLLGRAGSARVSAFGGIGFGNFRESSRSIFTRTGCTGPWVVACGSNDNGESAADRAGHALLLSGGADITLLPRLDLFVAGRLGGGAGLEESALIAGIRMTLISERARRDIPRTRHSTAGPVKVRPGEPVWVTYQDGTEDRGTLLASSEASVSIRSGSRMVMMPLTSVRSIEAPDSMLSGMLWGAGAGFGAGIVIDGYGNWRALPAAVLIGAWLGALVDALVPSRQLVYSGTARAVDIAPAVGPGLAALGVRVSWQ